MSEPRPLIDKPCTPDLPDFWERVKQAQFRLLSLDYDGTLAPFRSQRMEAVPLPDVREVLGYLCTCPHMQIVIVSGRPVQEVLQLLGDVDLAVIGSHGYEWKLCGQDIEVFPPSNEAIHGLAAAIESAAAAGLSGCIEKKIASVALHVRGRENADEILTQGMTLWQPLAASQALAIHSFHGGIELRATERDKGVAVAELMKMLPLGSLTVHMGDDNTDEDVFRMLHRHRGIGIKVGSLGANTAAAAHLDNSEQVLEFLRIWQNTVCGADHTEDR